MLLSIVPFSAPTFHCSQAHEGCPCCVPFSSSSAPYKDGWCPSRRSTNVPLCALKESSWMQRLWAIATVAELATQVTGRKSRRQRGDYLARTAALRQAMKGTEVTSGNDRYVSSSHRSSGTLSASTRTTERSYCSAAARPCKCNLFGAGLLRPS